MAVERVQVMPLRIPMVVQEVVAMVARVAKVEELRVAKVVQNVVFVNTHF